MSPTRHRIIPPLLILLLGLTAQALAQKSARTIYAVVLGNQKYVVGSSTLRSGLFASTDLGESWTHLGPENLKAFSMDAVDSSRGRIIFIAAGNGVHRSTDGGASWKIVTDWRMTEVLDVKVDQRHPDVIHAATAFGLWESSDGGDTWRPTSNSRLDSTYCYRFAENPWNERLTLLTEERVVVTRERSFDSVDDLPLKSIRSILPLGDDQIVVGSALGPLLMRSPVLTGVEMDHSADNAEQETDMRRRFALDKPEMQVYDMMQWGLTAMIAAGSDGIWSYDLMRGDGWMDLTDGLPIRTVHAIAFVDGRLLAGTFGEGVFWRDGSTWKQRGLEGGQIWRIVVKNW